MGGEIGGRTGLGIQAGGEGESCGDGKRMVGEGGGKGWEWCGMGRCDGVRGRGELWAGRRGKEWRGGGAGGYNGVGGGAWKLWGREDGMAEGGG